MWGTFYTHRFNETSLRHHWTVVITSLESAPFCEPLLSDVFHCLKVTIQGYPRQEWRSHFTGVKKSVQSAFSLRGVQNPLMRSFGIVELDSISNSKCHGSQHVPHAALGVGPMTPQALVGTTKHSGLTSNISERVHAHFS